MNSDVIAYRSRYVVPFYFDYENRGYENIRNYFVSNTSNNQEIGLPKGEWIISGFWENYRSEKEKQAEMDLYSYLPSIFLEDNNTNAKDISNLGVSFVYKTTGKLFELDYRYNEKSIGVDCTELGILLLRNGIGFIWYETKFKSKVVHLDEYVRFQHDFKELARPHEEKFVKKTGYDEKEGKATYESFCLGKWLSKIVEADDLGIRFWAERKTRLEDGNVARIPDKALLFQYLFVEQMTNQERNDIVFRITNGYDEKYNAPENIDENLYKPFGNSCFYISKAGMACVVRDEDTNRDFFIGDFPVRFVRDFFFIYMLLAYQSYSCAHYSRLLTKLPADVELYSAAAISELESLNEQINLFLVKSVFESVSNIHHQDGVYQYGKGTLRIEENIKSLTIGLEALGEIEKEKRLRAEQEAKDWEKEKQEKRDRRINFALTVFGLIVVVSALIDGLNLVDWFNYNKGHLGCWHWAIVILIAIPTVVLIIMFLISLVRTIISFVRTKKKQK